MTGAPRVQNRTLKTRRRITLAALQLFCEYGYVAVSMDDIAARAECSKGGLYHHFPGKARVLEAVAGLLTAEGVTAALLRGGSLPVDASRSQMAGLVVEIWAEAGRSGELRGILDTGDRCTAEDLVRMGAVVQSVALTAPAEEERRAA